MQNIFSTINYKYPLPLNYEANNPEFDIFENIPDEKCFAPKIEFLKNVRISINSVVFRYFKIFKESCINEKTYQEYQKGFRFFLKFIFPKFNFSKKRFLLISDEWTSNYYHWHVFALKKLLILKEKNLIENSLLLLPKKYQSYKFALSSIEKFGIKKNQIVFLRKKSNIKVAELPLITASRQHPSAFQKISKILTKDADKIDQDFGEKIYISRAEQVLRFVENEKEVVALLEKYGFKKIIMEKFSYDEQIAICAKAKYLVSPHGAGLTNVLFMKKGSYVLEMSTPQTAEGFNKDFYAISSMLDLNYLYQKCEMGENSRVRDFHQASLVVDLEKLEKNLKLMLKS
jgi:capsular polysaccharide biosynthesis protein